MIKSAEAKGKRCMFWAHRKELIDQCSGRLDQFEISHGVIQAKHPRTNPERQVQVASVFTLPNRDHFHADLVIIDECHRSTSPVYQNTLEKYPNAVVIGLTATPYRSDGRGLGELYDDLCEVTTTQKLIDDGFLVEPTVYGAATLDLSKVALNSKGEYRDDQLADAVKPTIFRGDIINNWISHVQRATNTEDPAECRACTIVFAVNVEQSKIIAQQFVDAGIPAAHLDHSMTNERDQILADLRSGKLSVVVNVGILTEGFDIPHLECVVIVRPTRSRSLYKQMIGRLLRPSDMKRFAYVMDHANCTRLHGFVNDPETYSLASREKRPRKGSAEIALKECNGCRAILPMSTRECPECGYRFPEKSYANTDEELIKLSRENISNSTSKIPLETRQKEFDLLCLRCRENEYKPTWARVQYMKQFGEWPKWDTGVRTPGFFRQYEKQYNDRLKAQGRIFEQIKKNGTQA